MGSASQTMIESLKLKLLDPDWGKALKASVKLTKLQAKASIPYFIDLLSHTNPAVRNLAALALSDLTSQEALPHLKEQIKLQPGNSGTLTYALESLVCSGEGVFIFNLLFFGSAEDRMSVVSILHKQNLKISPGDRQIILEKWQKYQDSQEVHPDDKQAIEALLIRHALL